MPKKMVAGVGEADGGLGVTALPIWQATGLSLAVIVGQVLNGSGALVFGLLAVGVIWTLHRLRVHAPQARTTADLIASVPGAAPARAVTAIQFTAYVLIGAYAANKIAGMALVFIAGSDRTEPEWWGLALAVGATVMAALIVAALPTRLLAPVATVLAVFGVLVYFYVGLAVIARVASGAPPVQPIMDLGTTPSIEEWGPVALLLSLAVMFVGFEIVTAVSDRLTSVRKPLGFAIAATALCATVAWVAANVGSTNEFRYDAADLVLIVTEMFGDSGTLWLLAATITQAVAALLVVVWGATRVIRPADGYSPMPLVITTVAIGVLGLVIAAGWLDAGTKFWGVAGVLLLVVYMLAAQANSRLDDSSTTAWALFALMGVVLAVFVFVKGAIDGWWPIGIAAVIVAAAVAWSAKSRSVSPENRTS